MQIGRPEAVEAALPSLPPGDREAVSAELVPLFVAQLERGSVNEARDARDGLFSLREGANPALQKQIDAALLPSLARELRAGRVAGGRYTMDRMLLAMGPPAAPDAAADPGRAGGAVPGGGRGAGQDRRPRDRATRRPPRWSSARGQQAGHCPRSCGGRWARSAASRRWSSCRRRSSRATSRDAVLAAQALQQGPRMPGLVTLAMRLAGNQRANKAVRDEMFGLLEYVGTPEAKDGRGEHHRHRPRAAGALPGLRDGAGHRQGRRGGRRRWRRSRPAATHKREDVVDFLAKDIQKIGPATGRPAAVSALASKSPLARMTGVLALETIGTAAEAPAVAKLAGDRATVKGFPPGPPWARKRPGWQEYCRRGQTVVNRKAAAHPPPGKARQGLRMNTPMAPRGWIDDQKMTADPNRKTLRHFYCRDALWHSFERMSEDLDRGVDELVNEAMRVFAREKGYLPTESDAPRATGRARAAGAAAAAPPDAAAAAGARRCATPPPFPGRSPQLPGPGSLSQELPMEEASAAPPVYLVFQNQKYLVDKEQFIIGRGSKSSDLPIRDGNISRKHAAVIRRNGAYYIKDLGSTNGIDYNGVRIDNKRIEEGDVFTICDYELRFTFR